MKELVEYLVKALVDKPDEVSISQNDGEAVTTIEIRAANDDIGKVIGRDGRIANSIRTIAKAAAAKQNKRISVEIMTEDRQKREPR